MDKFGLVLSWSHSGVFFTIMFVAAALGQSVLWQSHDFIDQDVWEERVDIFARAISSRSVVFSQKGFSAHPGTSMISVAGILRAVGLGSKHSLVLGVSLLNAGLIAGAAVMCRELRPGLWWWLPVFFVLLGHSLYRLVSPTSAVIVPAVVLLYLSGLWMVERSIFNWGQCLVMGVAMGIGFATRLPITLLFSGPLVVYLFFFSSKRVVWVVPLSLLVWLLFDPLLWLVPMEHLSLIFNRTALHVTHQTLGQLSWRSLVSVSSLALMAVIMSILSVSFNRKALCPVRVGYVVLLWVVTVMISLVLFEARTSAIRYFFPLIMLWEVLLPLWLLHFMSGLPNNHAGWLRRVGVFNVLIWMVVIAQPLGHILMLMHNLS